MGWFKSDEEKRLEREIEMKRTIAQIKKNIREQQQFTQSYIDQAKRAKRIGDLATLQQLKGLIKKTATVVKMRERQLLSLEMTLQIKKQAESDSEFAKAMSTFAQSIAAVYKSVDYVQVAKQTEEAFQRANTIQERMQLMLDMTQDSINTNMESSEDLVSDKDIDKMIDEQVMAEDGQKLDAEISKGIKQIEDELKG